MVWSTRGCPQAHHYVAKFNAPRGQGSRAPRAPCVHTDASSATFARSTAARAARKQVTVFFIVCLPRCCFYCRGFSHFISFFPFPQTDWPVFSVLALFFFFSFFFFLSPSLSTIFRTLILYGMSLFFFFFFLVNICHD